MKERISISPKENWAGRDRFQAVVTIRTVDGRRFEREEVYRRMTEEDVDAKFFDLVGMRSGEAKARELAQALKSLGTVSNVAGVMTQLELPPARIEDF